MEKIIKRINELSKKQKTVGLSDAEKQEQQQLRQQYLKIFRDGFKKRLENIEVETPDGKIHSLNEYKKK